MTTAEAIGVPLTSASWVALRQLDAAPRAYLGAAAVRNFDVLCKRGLASVVEPPGDRRAPLCCITWEGRYWLYQNDVVEAHRCWERNPRDVDLTRKLWDASDRLLVYLTRTPDSRGPDVAPRKD